MVCLVVLNTPQKVHTMVRASPSSCRELDGPEVVAEVVVSLVSNGTSIGAPDGI